MIVVDGNEVFTELDEVVSPAHTALLVIDFQGRNWGGGNADRESVLSNTAAVLEAAREAGILVIYTVNIHQPRHRSLSGAHIRRLIREGYKPGEDPIPYPIGTEATEIPSAIAPKSDERVLGKYRANAFKGTELEVLLSPGQVKTIVFAGRSTDWCVEATLWEAIARDYYTLVLEDCVHSGREEGHRAALQQMEVISEVATSGDVTKIWETSRRYVD